MSISVQKILDYLVSLNPDGRLGREEGVIYGEPDREAEAVLVTWMSTVAAIAHAVSEGCGIIVSHEALTFHDYFPNASSPNPWTADRARLSLLKKHGITVIRAHSTVDPTHVVPAFIRAVGLSDPVDRGHVWSLHREDPISLRALSRKVADGLGMPHLRVTGNPDRVVTHIGTMVGGLMQDRHIKSWETYLMHRDVQVIIGGETNDFAQRFAVDSEVALIETCHSTSEEPGLRDLAGDLKSELPGIRVIFHRETVPWVTL